MGALLVQYISLRAMSSDLETETSIKLVAPTGSVIKGFG